MRNMNIYLAFMIVAGLAVFAASCAPRYRDTLSNPNMNAAVVQELRKINGKTP